MASEEIQALALMDVSIALLHEAYDRLESLCRVLPDSTHRNECSETARHIHAHLRTLNQQMVMLRSGRN
jgi:hypothetical protein